MQEGSDQATSRSKSSLYHFLQLYGYKPPSSLYSNKFHLMKRFEGEKKAIKLKTYINQHWYVACF